MRNNIINSLLFGISLSILIVIAGPVLIFFQSDFEEVPEQENSSELQLSEIYGRLPIRFERNDGQTEKQADFLAKGKNSSMFLSSTGALLSMQNTKSRGQVTKEQRRHETPQSIRLLHMRLVGANSQAKGYGLNELITKSNYFIGNNKEKWITDIPNYSMIEYRNVYPDIDLCYYGNQGKLEFDFMVAPHADPGVIVLKLDGSADQRIDEKGNLILSTYCGELTMQEPLAYQEKSGIRETVHVKYLFRSNEYVGLEIGEYDESRTLIIDPVIIYSTFLGIPGTGEDVVVDEDGFVYIVGSDGTDAFVTKLHPDSSSLIYKTILGGQLDDFGHGIAIDTAGNVYVTGETQSDDFPVQDAVQQDFGGDLWVDGDAFICKLDPDGKIVYSTYLGGESEDIGNDIAVDLSGNAYVTGKTISWNFPVADAYQGSLETVDMFTWGSDVFITKLKPDGSEYVFSTYLGGGLHDAGAGITLDNANNIYITGYTSSTDFPTTAGAYQTQGRGSDAFVTKMNAQGTDLVFSTYLTGGTDPNYSQAVNGLDIAVDGANNAVIFGSTSSPQFPTTNAVQPSLGGDADNFVTKFTTNGSSLLFSTYLGGNDYEGQIGSITVDAEDNVFVTGQTQSNNFPIERPILNSLAGVTDGFITGISSDGVELIFSSYLGGSGYDAGHGIFVAPNGNIWVTGGSTSSDFPQESPLPTGSSGAFATEIILEDEEMLVVEVLQDSLSISEPTPVANTKMDIYYIDLSKPPDDPFTYLETQVTDDKGLLHLRTSEYEPGWPLLIRTRVATNPAVKKGHEYVDDAVYNVYIDNLHIDKNGITHAAFLETDKEDTTRMYLEHMLVLFNLVVSIEWPASAEYVDGLKENISDASKLMYDIADGQACLQSIVIYDNGDHWTNADIQIHASNTQWPMANVDGYKQQFNTQVLLPPRDFGGNISRNINRIFEDADPGGGYYNTVATVHELGHYLFGFYDEYESSDGTAIYPNINFGFMDGPGEYENDMHSEMSAFVTTEYVNTEQFQKNRSHCWGYFWLNFRYVFGSMRAELHDPELLGLNPGEFIPGPTSANGLGVVSASLDIIDKTGPDSGPRLEYIVKDENGQPLPGATVAVKKQTTNRWIVEGKTVLSGPNRGKIRLFAAKSGDQLFFSRTEEPHNYKFLETIVQPSGLKMAKYINQEIVNEAVLKNVQGTYKLLNQVRFTATDELEFQILSESNLASVPTIQIIQNTTVSDEIPMTSTTEGFSLVIPDTIGSDAECILRTLDSAGTSFFIPQQLNLIHLDRISTHLVTPRANFEMWLDSTSESLTDLAILSSDFPSPVTGLPDSMRRASPVFAINQRPENADFGSRIRIYYSADTLAAANPAAVTIYHWQDAWQPMPTTVDTGLSFATTYIEEPGFYTTFLDLTQSVVVTDVGSRNVPIAPQGFRLFQNYPNPFNTTTTICFDLPETSDVKITIFNILGQKVTVLTGQKYTAGQHQIKWDGHDQAGRILAHGIYIYCIQSNSRIQSRQMLFLP